MIAPTHFTEVALMVCLSAQFAKIFSNGKYNYVAKNSILYPNTANSSERDLGPVEETPTTETLLTVDLEEMNKTIDDLNHKIKNLEAPPQSTQLTNSNFNNQQVILKC